jgi:hypothetical protein
MILFAKSQGLSYFKNGDLEFSFGQRPKAAPTAEAQDKLPIPEGMPSDEDLLFASVENIEFPKK